MEGTSRRFRAAIKAKQEEERQECKTTARRFKPIAKKSKMETTPSGLTSRFHDEEEPLHTYLATESKKTATAENLAQGHPTLIDVAFAKCQQILLTCRAVLDQFSWGQQIKLFFVLFVVLVLLTALAFLWVIGQWASGGVSACYRVLEIAINWPSHAIESVAAVPTMIVTATSILGVSLKKMGKAACCSLPCEPQMCHCSITANVSSQNDVLNELAGLHHTVGRQLFPVMAFVDLSAQEVLSEARIRGLAAEILGSGVSQPEVLSELIIKYSADVGLTRDAFFGLGSSASDYFFTQYRTCKDTLALANILHDPELSRGWWNKWQDNRGYERIRMTYRNHVESFIRSLEQVLTYVTLTKDYLSAASKDWGEIYHEREKALVEVQWRLDKLEPWHRWFVPQAYYGVNKWEVREARRDLEILQRVQELILVAPAALKELEDKLRDNKARLVVMRDVLRQPHVSIAYSPLKIHVEALLFSTEELFQQCKFLPPGTAKLLGIDIH